MTYLINSVKEDGIASGQIIRRKEDGSLEYQPDDLTIEEPLEIRSLAGICSVQDRFHRLTLFCTPLSCV